jgi:Peptidase M15
MLSPRLSRSAAAAICSLFVVFGSVATDASPAAPRGAAVLGGQGLSPKLLSLLRDVSRQFGRPVIVSSGCRTSHGNRRAGGAKRSFHLRCMAADIKVVGVSESQVLRIAQKLPARGGIGTYCRNSVVHIDVGPRREWHQRCGRKKSRSLVQFAGK